MYTTKGNGIVWDKDNNKPLAKFTGGSFSTEDRNVAEKLAALGYEVAGLEESPKDENPLEKMTKAELEAYAAEHDIDLGKAATKTAMLEVIAVATEREQE